MALTMYDKHVPVSHEEEVQLPERSHNWEMLENKMCFLKQINHDKP